jgi:hypothetical protein
MLRRKDLALVLPIPDALVRAIGHIITQWAYFEAGIDEELRQLGGDRNTLSAPTKKRLKAWRDLSLKAYRDNADHVRLVRQIYQTATSLKRGRDEASHGRWGSSGRSIDFIHQRHGELIEINERKNAVAELERLARQISEMNATHFRLQADTLDLREPPR